MFKKLTILTVMIFMALVITSPAVSYAQDQRPVTAIDKILEYKNGLGLTDSQLRKLDIINRTIIQKMIEIKKQANIRKLEIDDFTSNWSSMHGTAVIHIIKEYYDFMADLKRLELEAITKARDVLNDEQLKKLSELSSIEAMMIKVENELAVIY